MRHAGERRSRRGPSIAPSSSASHRVSSRCQASSAATRAHEDAGLEDDDDDDDDASSSSDEAREADARGVSDERAPTRARSGRAARAGATPRRLDARAIADDAMRARE